jgi:hypothetical protein
MEAKGLVCEIVINNMVDSKIPKSSENKNRKHNLQLKFSQKLGFKKN